MKSLFNMGTVLAFSTIVFATIRPSMAQPDLNGAWRIVQATGHSASGDYNMKNMQPSLVLFQDGYYSILVLMTEKERPRIAEGETFSTLPEDKLREMVIDLWANSGRYEINGSILKTTPIVAKNPNRMDGSSISYTISMDGSDLHLLIKSDNGMYWQDITLVRME